MRLLFLGDIVGNAGRLDISQNLKKQIIKKDISFVIANGENAANEGVGITKNISESLFNSGVDVITTGNHVWDRKEIMECFERNGIKTLIHYPVLNSSQGGISNYKISPEGILHAKNHSLTCVSLPIHPFLTQDEVSKIISVSNSIKIK